MNRFDFPLARELPLFMNALSAVGLALGIRWWACSPRADTPLGASLPKANRWAIVAVLWAIPILYLWPW
jgi:hypothetical protein